MEPVTPSSSTGSTPEETRGFVWWAVSLLVLVLYVVWTVVPTPAELAQSALCQGARSTGVRCQAAQLSVYVFPDKYWLTALPALLVVLVLLAVVGYCGVLLRTGAAPTARAAWRSHGEPPHGTPAPALARQDVPLQAVSAALHLRPHPQRERIPD